MPERISVAIVEDDKPFLARLAALIGGEPGFECVATCSSAAQAEVEVPKANPDIILLDLMLPRGSGFDLIRCFREKLPDSDVAILTSFGDDLHLFRAMQAGAVAYLVKASTSGAELMDSLREVAVGGSPMSASVARRVVQFLHHLPPELRNLVQLNPEQRDLLDRIDRGQLVKRIAIDDKVSQRTISNRLRTIYQVLEVASKSDALRVHQFGKNCGI